MLLERQKQAARARAHAVHVISRLRTAVSDVVERHPQLAAHGGLPVRRSPAIAPRWHVAAAWPASCLRLHTVPCGAVSARRARKQSQHLHRRTSQQHSPAVVARRVPVVRSQAELVHGGAPSVAAAAAAALPMPGVAAVGGAFDDLDEHMMMMEGCGLLPPCQELAASLLSTPPPPGAGAGAAGDDMWAM